MGLRIIVVGAGIGGLAAAVALRRAGHEVTVLEKYSSKSEVGFAVGLFANATRVLQSLDVDFKRMRTSPWINLTYVRADLTPMKVVEAVSEGETKVSSIDYGAPSCAAHRVDLHKTLRDHATRVEGVGPQAVITEGQAVIDYSPDTGSVTLQSGEILAADAVVAADGVKSKAHISIIGYKQPATLTKLSSVRFVLPTEKFKEIPELQVQPETEKYPVAYTGPSYKVGLLRYPCREGTLQNFSLFEYNDDTPGSEGKWRTQTQKEIAFERLKGFNNGLHEVVRQANEKEMYLWKVADRMPLPCWTKDKMTLLGDAAHPMRPSLGNGAAQAIEDAGVLATVLQGVEDPADVPERLKLYEELRRPRASAAQLLSMSDSLAYELSDEVQKVLRTFVADEDFPELSRPGANHFLCKFDCIAEAEKVVSERYGRRTDSIQGVSIYGGQSQV